MKMVNVLLWSFLLAASVNYFSDNAADPDLWGHLQFGEDIWRERSVVREDPYSYSSPKANWINHEWLAELLTFAAFSAGGGAGLIIGKTVVGLLLTLLLIRFVFGATTSLFLRILMVVVPLSALSYGFATRPQVFTCLFFTVELWLLVRFDQTARPACLYWLAPLFVFWCNLHGGFVAGLGLLGVFTVFHVKTWRRVMPPVALAGLATLINPYGIGLWEFLFMSLSKARPYLPEWQPTGLELAYADYHALLLLTCIAFMACRRACKLWHVALLLMVMLVSLKQNRHTVFMGPVAALLATPHLESAFGSWLRDLEHRLKPLFFVLLLGGGTALFMAKTVVLERAHPLQVEVPADEYPMDAVSFMKANGIAGNLFCYFDWAQMCIREFHGRCPMFCDGRFDTVYEYGLIERYFQVLYGAVDPGPVLESYPETDIVLIREDSGMAVLLRGNDSWAQIYSTDLCRLYLRRNERNRDVLTRWEQGRLVPPDDAPPYFLR